MAKGFKKGAGGANPLSFKVVGGTTEPANPKENVIWVNTDQKKIPGWYFQHTQPEDGDEGEIWFDVGISSTVKFNALKKNSLMVYPLFAKQYIGGVWVDKTAKIYQGGMWVDWIAYILHKSNVYNGWTANGGTSIAVEDGGIRFSRHTGYGSCNSDVKFDVSKFNTVKLKYSEYTGVSNIQLMVHNALTGSGITPLIEVKSSSGESGEINADLSGVKSYGEVYIAFGIYGANGTSVLIESIWFE